MCRFRIICHRVVFVLFSCSKWTRGRNYLKIFACSLHLCMTLLQNGTNFSTNYIFVTAHRSNHEVYITAGMKLVMSTESLQYSLCSYDFVESRMLEEGMKKPPWRPLHLMGVSTCLIGTHMFTHFPHNLQKYTGKNTQNKKVLLLDCERRAARRGYPMSCFGGRGYHLSCPGVYPMPCSMVPDPLDRTSNRTKGYPLKKQDQWQD